jgi:hypothetical protein
MCVQARIGAKVAGKDAYIRGFDMEVAVEEGVVPMLLLPHIISQSANKRQTALLKKQQALFICYPGLVQNSIAYVL